MSENQNERVPFTEKAKNLAKFSWDLVKYLHENAGESLTVNDKVYEERILTCKSCPAYLELQNECNECGCYVPMKAKIIMNSCPLGKWSESKEDWDEIFGKIVETIDNDQKSE